MIKIEKVVFNFVGNYNADKEFIYEVLIKASDFDGWFEIPIFTDIKHARQHLKDRKEFIEARIVEMLVEAYGEKFKGVYIANTTNDIYFSFEGQEDQAVTIEYEDLNADSFDREDIDRMFTEAHINDELYKEKTMLEISRKLKEALIQFKELEDSYGLQRIRDFTYMLDINSNNIFIANSAEELYTDIVEYEAAILGQIRDFESY